MDAENEQFHKDCDELKGHMLNFMRNTKLSGIDPEVIVAAQSISMIDYIFENEKHYQVRKKYIQSIRDYLDEIERQLDK